MGIYSTSLSTLYNPYRVLGIQSLSNQLSLLTVTMIIAMCVGLVFPGNRVLYYYF